MIEFARTAEAIAATASTLEKVSLLAAYLRRLDDNADLAAAAKFFSTDRRLGAGWRTIVAAAKAAWGVADRDIGEGYRRSGDLGAALAPHVRPSQDLGLFRTDLTPRSFAAVLDEIAAASGKAAGKRRTVLVERLLASCGSPLEAKYAIKILTGELRIGLREGLIVEAIAEAFAAALPDVRRAAMAAGDIGAVAVAARRGRLAEVEIAYGSPIAFMLASPMQFGSEYRELAGAAWLVEDKYDGVRVQAHKRGDSVRLFTRRLNDSSAAWPEIVDALQTLPGDAILDGEIVAARGEAVLPFRFLQTRLQRKTPTEQLREDVPVRYVVFDCLARGTRFLLDESLEVRREALADLALDGSTLRRAPWSALETGSSQAEVRERFEAARERGNEGLMFKRADAPYAPGKRGKWWLKLKRQLDTLDCVVVAVEWGNGKRAGVLSDYTFAVRGPENAALVIGKAYSGLTDAEIAEMTAWFLAHRIPEPLAERAYAELGLQRAEIPVEPSVVVEIAFDIVARSTLHKSGYALRFPRIVRIRDDKPATECDSIARVDEIYQSMLAREGISE